METNKGKDGYAKLTFRPDGLVDVELKGCDAGLPPVDAAKAVAIVLMSGDGGAGGSGSPGAQGIAGSCSLTAKSGNSGGRILSITPIEGDEITGSGSSGGISPHG